MNKPFPYRNQLITVSLFACMGLILLIKLRTFFNFYDEGFAMFGPTRILNGDLPYKDFWAIYPPGQFYIIALIIKLFGPNLVYARLYDTLIRFLMIIGVYRIAGRVASPRMALLSAGIATFLLASAGFYSYAIFPAMTLGIWAIVCWLRFSERGQMRWLILAGMLLGVAAIIRWDIGIYGAISVLVGGYAFLFARQFQSAEHAPVRFHFSLVFSPLPQMAAVLIPMLVLAISAYTYIGLTSGWQNLYEQVFYFPAVVLHSVRWLAYPPLQPKDWIPDADWLRFYFPLLTFAAAIIALMVQAITAIRQRTHLDSAYFTLLSILVFGGLLFNQALSRYDLIHVTPASILTFVIAAALFQRAAPLAQSGARVARSPRNAAGVLLFCLVALYFPYALQDLLRTLDYSAPWTCQSSLPILSCTAVSPDEEKAAVYIQLQTRPGEAIFVGNQKHNRIFVNDIGFYYLAGRPSSSRYHELYPAVATTLPIQQQIVNELETKQVKWVVLVKVGDSEEPNLSAADSGVFFLDEYIRFHYSEMAEFGTYRIMERDPQ